MLKQGSERRIIFKHRPKDRSIHLACVAFGLNLFWQAQQRFRSGRAHTIRQR